MAQIMAVLSLVVMAAFVLLFVYAFFREPSIFTGVAALMCLAVVYKITRGLR